jgi:hypothetical protein
MWPWKSLKFSLNKKHIIRCYRNGL